MDQNQIMRTVKRDRSERAETRARNVARGFGRLHPDAPAVPDGLKPRDGIDYGCGKPECQDCYEPDPRCFDTSAENPASDCANFCTRLDCGPS